MALPVPHNAWTNRPEYEEAALRVLRSGWVGPGPEVALFEDELAARFRPGGAACCVSSGSAAVLIALQIIRPDVAAVPTYACVGIYAAARRVGEVRLADCDLDTLNTPRASVVVHTYGLVSEVPWDSVEDFTHAPGATYDGAPCGSLSAMSVVSFGATKPLGVGGGGALLGSKEDVERARHLRDHDAWLSSEAFNWGMSDLLASVGRIRLRHLDEENAWRQRVAHQYSMAGRAYVAGADNQSQTPISGVGASGAARAYSGTTPSAEVILKKRTDRVNAPTNGISEIANVYAQSTGRGGPPIQSGGMIPISRSATESVGGITNSSLNNREADAPSAAGLEAKNTCPLITTTQQGASGDFFAPFAIMPSNDLIPSPTGPSAQPNICWPSDTHYRYVICVKDVDKARAHFAASGVQSINPLRPDELIHRRLRIAGRHFPNAERAAHNTLSLPIWPGMDDHAVDRVCSALAGLALP